MRISRDHYVDELMSRRENGFVKIITGIRRCGKSYLLDTLFRERLIAEGVKRSHIISIDLDDDERRPLHDPLKLSAYIRQATKADAKRSSARKRQDTYYVFIDEIQRCRKVLPEGVDLSRTAPEDRDDAYVTFYDVLNGLRKLPNVDLYVTGSNSKMLSNDIPTHFRDRGQQIRIQPLSFAEWLPTSGITDDKQEAFGQYLVWGGMPAAAAEPDKSRRSAYLKGLFDEVYLKDIRERYDIRDDTVISSVIDILSSGIGSLTNPHRLGDTMNSLLKLHPSDNTLKAYLDYLEDAFLFTKARRFDVKGKKYIDSPFKFYAADLGLRNARLNFRDTDPSHPMENVIFNELLRRGCNVDVGVVPIATVKDGVKETRQHEIDFVVNRGNDRLYIQSAFELGTSAKREQERLSLKKSGDFFAKVVVTSGYGQPQRDEDGIIHVGIIPFLLDEKVLADIMAK